MLDPSGNPFRARGINVIYSQPWGPPNTVDITTLHTASVILSNFPGINFVRFAYWYGDLYPDPTDPAVQAWVNALTDAGVVVMFDFHSAGIGPDDAQGVSDMVSWLGACAAVFKSNPYCWYETMNEATLGSSGYAGMSSMMLAGYNAVRSTGATAPVVFCMGGQDPSQQATFTPMTNVCWDVHYYGWMSVGSSDNYTFLGQLNGFPGFFGDIGSMTSQNGIIPAFCFECGDATDGSDIDSNWQPTMQQVYTPSLCPNGFAVWLANFVQATGGGDELFNGPSFNGNDGLTALGTDTAYAIANNASPI